MICLAKKPFAPAGNTQPQTPAVRISRLSKWIDQRPILREIDLQIDPGEYIALLGANGAGKSSLLRIIAMLNPASEGELELFSRPSSRDSAVLLRRIGLIGDQSMLYRELSALENLTFFARLYRLADPAATARRMLRMVGLRDRGYDPIKTFSRGMTQRVAIARALLHDPELILADEPFAGLDLPSIHSLEKLLQRLHEAGKTIVVVNHDIEQSLRLVERVIVLRDGAIVLDEPAEQVSTFRLLREVTGL